MKIMLQDKTLRDNFAMIFEITDVQVAYIQEHPEVMLTIDYVMKAMAEKGNNAHIAQLTLNDKVAIVHYAQELLKRYDSVSWFNREHKFHIMRRVKCHQ